MDKNIRMGRENISEGEQKLNRNCSQPRARVCSLLICEKACVHPHTHACCCRSGVKRHRMACRQKQAGGRAHRVLFPCGCFVIHLLTR